MPIDSLDSHTTLKQLIAARQAELKFGDHYLAHAMGYDSSNVIAMIKSGSMRLPIDKARALADALQVEPGAVMRMLLGDTSPEILRGIEDCLGPLSLTSTEVRLIRKLREAAAGEATSPLFLDGNSVVAIITKK